MSFSLNDGKKIMHDFPKTSETLKMLTETETSIEAVSDFCKTNNE